jgi:hypothetical protein
LEDLAFGSLHLHYKEKLEGFDFLSINQVQVRALSLEYKFKNSKDTYITHWSNTHVVDCESDSSDDEEKEVYAAKFVWPSKAKSYTCSSLKPNQKNRQEEV